MTASPKQLTNRTYVLIAVAALLAGVWAGASVDSYLLERDADLLVEGLVEEYRPEGYGAATLVNAHREYLLVGVPTLRVELYFRQEEPERVVQGIEFLYTRHEEGWILLESFGCSSEESRTRGKIAFASGDVYPVRASAP